MLIWTFADIHICISFAGMPDRSLWTPVDGYEESSYGKHGAFYFSDFSTPVPYSATFLFQAFELHRISGLNLIHSLMAF